MRKQSMKGKIRRAGLVALVVLLSAAMQGGAQQPYTWKPVKIVAGGYVPGLIFHPAQQGLMYARTDMGGTYRYEATEHRWVALNDWTSMDEVNNFGIESVGIDPHDATKLYEAVGMYSNSWNPDGFILRSDDQGRTFKKSALPIKMGGNEDGRISGERLVVDPHNSKVLYFGSRHNGLWKSEDGAETWHKVDSFPAYDDNGAGAITELFAPSSVTVASGTAQVSANFFVAVSSKNGGFFHTADGGKSWEKVAGQPTGLLITNATMASDGKLYAAYGDKVGPSGLTSGAVWQLDTATGKWNEITPLKPGTGKDDAKFGYGGVAVSATHPELLLVSTLNRWWPSDVIYRSTDSGKHWTEITDSHEPRAMSLSPWLRMPADVPLGTGPWPTALAIDPFDGNHVLFGTGATVWETHDANGLEEGRFIHWKVGAEGIEETATIALLSPPAGPHLFTALGDIGGFRHDDFTVSPQGGYTENPRFSNTNAIVYATQNPQLMVRVGKTWVGKIFGAYSKDQGLHWTPFASQPEKSTGGGTAALSADGGSLVWASDDAPISFSRDLGTSWTASTLPSAPKMLQVVADPVQPGRFYLYEPEEGAVLVSSDGGASFSAYLGGLPKAGPWQHAHIYATPGKAGDLWVGSELGLFHSIAFNQPFAPLTAVEKAIALGFGKAAQEGGYPALYLAGRSAGATEIYRSDDAGTNWVRINDDAHRFGWIAAISGDPRIYGRAYLGTEGRGVLYGDPASGPALK
jgi:photosystem II stability/assembly factor-like uncharacterized protein